MKRIIKVTATYDLNDPELTNCKITPKEKVKTMVTKEAIDMFGWDKGYEDVKVEVIDTDTIEETERTIEILEKKIKTLEKSNKNWRRKCQRLRKAAKWTDERIKPIERKRVIVKDDDGEVYSDHEWLGHAWYRFVGCDGWRTDVNVVSWKYQ